MSSDIGKGKRRRKNVQKLNALMGEKLIETVRANAGLYDPSQKIYADFSAKAKLWNEVGHTVGLKSGYEAKMMWKNLRDCYRICRKKMHYNPNAKMWKFYERMKFLTPYIKDRKWKYIYANTKNKETDDSTKPDDSTSPVVNSSVDVSGIDREFATVQYWNEGDVKPVISEIDTEASVIQHPVVDTPQEGQAVNRSRDETCNNESDDESYEDILPEALNNGSVDQSLKMFFDAMYASTSNLPHSVQRQVKNKVFKAVLEGEEEAERLSNINASTTTTEKTTSARGKEGN